MVAFALSPDGTRIAYYAGGDLWVADVAGTKPDRVFGGAPKPGAPVGAPSWSPDGTSILALQQADPAADNGSFQTVRVRLSDRVITVVHPWTSPRPFDQETAW